MSHTYSQMYKVCGPPTPVSADYRPIQQMLQDSILWLLQEPHTKTNK